MQFYVIKSIVHQSMLTKINLGEYKNEREVDNIILQALDYLHTQNIPYKGLE